MSHKKKECLSSSLRWRWNQPLIVVLSKNIVNDFQQLTCKRDLHLGRTAEQKWNIIFVTKKPLFAFILSTACNSSLWISRRVTAESEKVQKKATDQGDRIAALLGEMEEGQTALFRKEKAEESTPGAYKIMTAVDAKDAFDDTEQYGYACGFSLTSLFYCHWQKQATETEGPLLWHIKLFLIIEKIWATKEPKYYEISVFTIYPLDVCVICICLFMQNQIKWRYTNKEDIC